jgi:hypothetical protein
MARTKPAPVLNRVASVIATESNRNIPINNYKEIQVGDIYILYYRSGSIPAFSFYFSSDISTNFLDSTPEHGNWFYFKVTKKLYNLIKNTQIAGNNFFLFTSGLIFTNDVIAYIHLKNARIDSAVATGSGTGGSPAAGTLVPTESRARTIISKNASTSTLVGTPNDYEQIWFGPSNLRQIFFQTTDFNTSNIVRSLTPATNAGAWTTRGYTIYSAEDKIVKPKSVPYVVDSYALSSQSGTKTAYLPSQTKAGDLVIAVKTALTTPTLPTGWTNLDSNDDSPEYRAYYKVITQQDIDDNLSIDTYDENEVIFAMNIRNFSNISVPVVKNTSILSTRTNLVLNPSIETAITGWENALSTTVTRITTDANFGLACGQGVTTATANSRVRITANATYRIPVVAGQVLTASAYVKNTSGTRNLRTQLRFYATATTTTLLQATNGTATTNPTDWTRVSVTATAPTNALFADMTIDAFTTGNIGDIYLFDNALIEYGNTLGTYFDGDYQPANTSTTKFFNNRWTNTPNNSTSTITEETQNSTALGQNITFDPQVISDAIQTTKPYQLGVFIGTKTIAEDFSEELDCVNEWQLVQTLNNTNKPGKALMVATYDAIEEQVIPPNQMAFKNSQDVLELAGGLAPTAISKAGRSITFLVDSA